MKNKKNQFLFFNKDDQMIISKVPFLVTEIERFNLGTKFYFVKYNLSNLISFRSSNSERYAFIIS